MKAPTPTRAVIKAAMAVIMPAIDCQNGSRGPDAESGCAGCTSLLYRGHGGPDSHTPSWCSVGYARSCRLWSFGRCRRCGGAGRISRRRPEGVPVVPLVWRFGVPAAGRSEGVEPLLDPTEGPP